MKIKSIHENCGFCKTVPTFDAFFLGAINRGDKIEKNRIKKKISENPEKPRKPLKTKG